MASSDITIRLPDDQLQELFERLVIHWHEKATHPAASGWYITGNTETGVVVPRYFSDKDNSWWLLTVLSSTPDSMFDIWTELPELPEEDEK